MPSVVAAAQSASDTHGCVERPASGIFVQNVETGEKIPMRQKGRSYVIDVNFIMKQQNLQQVFHGREM